MKSFPILKKEFMKILLNSKLWYNLLMNANFTS